MKIRQAYQLPADKEASLSRAVRLEWITIAFLLSIVAVMYLAMGSSQAMKMALIEDVLSLVPPTVFLLSTRWRNRPPSARYPYGFSRVTLLAFLVASAAIVLFGLFMLYDSGSSLLTRHRPTIGHFEIFGNHLPVWGGWVMIGALVYSMIPPFILGRMKQQLAVELHDSTLHADAAMNRADWLTAAAGTLGVLGIGLGFWWADAVAAGIIALDVLRDGVRNSRRAIGDLMDKRPSHVATGEPLGLEELVRRRLVADPGVTDAAVRLREEGHVVSGEAYVIPRDDVNPPGWLEQLAAGGEAVDWRLKRLAVMPVRRIEH